MIDRIMSATINGLASLALIIMSVVYYYTYSGLELVIASIVFSVFFAVRMVMDIKVYREIINNENGGKI